MTHVSHADLGGAGGYGAVLPEPEGELFHADWEPRVLALTLAMGATGVWNIDDSRAARESLPNYAKLSYYAIWFEALCRLLQARGLASAAEIESGRSLQAPSPQPRVLHAEHVATVLARGTAAQREPTRAARFAVGDAVRTHAGEVPHHTRLPRYARGKLGRIARVHGMHVFADAHATGRGEMPHWLYSVAFDGGELWGTEATPDTGVCIDAWEPYLQPA